MDNTKYEKLNIVKQVKIFYNYRGYDRILYLRPFFDTHIGYLSNTFFGYKDDNQKTVREPLEAIDHYLDNIPFHAPVLEYDTFIRKPEYKIYVTALKFRLDQYAKK